MKKTLLKRITIGTALFIAIAFGIWMSPFVSQAIKLNQKRRGLEKITNYAQITQDCLVLLSNLPPDTLMRNGDDRLPPFIYGLQPRSVYVGINSVRLEFAGGFDHFGYRLIPSQKSNQWTLNWYTEKSLKPLFSTEMQ